MSGQPVSSDASHPPHGHPENTAPSAQASDKPSTASHPPSTKPDATLAVRDDAAQGRLATSPSSGSSELSNIKVDLRNGLRRFSDFPVPGILFEDIMPLFDSPKLHRSLIHALELLVASVFNTSVGEQSDIDIIVGLESRGFLFGPTLAMTLGAGFVPVRKKGKLPGPCATEVYQKEYGADIFQMQEGAIKPGAKVVVVDDIIATGGSASAAGKLVRQLGGNLVGYIFILEIDHLKGRDKLDAPMHTLLSG